MSEFTGVGVVHKEYKSIIDFFYGITAFFESLLRVIDRIEPKTNQNELEERIKNLDNIKPEKRDELIKLLTKYEYAEGHDKLGNLLVEITDELSKISKESSLTLLGYYEIIKKFKMFLNAMLLYIYNSQTEKNLCEQALKNKKILIRLKVKILKKLLELLSLIFSFYDTEKSKLNVNTIGRLFQFQR